MNNKQRPSISLSVLLEKTHKLHLLLESVWNKKLSAETRDNIQWYCDWRLHQYYQQYQLHLKEQESYQSAKLKS